MGWWLNRYQLLIENDIFERATGIYREKAMLLEVQIYSLLDERWRRMEGLDITRRDLDFLGGSKPPESADPKPEEGIELEIKRIRPH